MVAVVDTHAFVWFLEGNEKLGVLAKSVMLDPDAEIVLPAIMLAEVVYLFNRKRIGVALPDVMGRVAQTGNCTIYPIDEVVVARLPVELEIHDALIVATALVFRDVLGRDVAVVTKDKMIRESGIIRTIW